MARPFAEPFVTKRQLAAHLACSTKTVERRMAVGLPSIADGKRRLFKISAVERWLKARQ
jgi:hypothetical protein